MACGMWNIDIPENTNKIADCPVEETKSRIEIKELQLGFRFYADMLNRLCFFHYHAHFCFYIFLYFCSILGSILI